MPRSLLGALWLQAVQSVTEGKRFRPCASCGRLIEISRDPTRGLRADATLCSNACRAREYRKRKTRARELAEMGWSAQRIAKKLGSNEDRVTAWIRSKEPKK